MATAAAHHVHEGPSAWTAAPGPITFSGVLRGVTERLRAPLAGGDERLVAALRAGDEEAFARLLDRYHASMVRVAQAYVRDRQAAEEVVQETWLAVVEGIERFEGRSSLRTWLFRILTNRAKSRGVREGRSVPFSALESAAAGPDEPAVDPDRFLSPDDPRDPRAWETPPRAWPETEALSREALAKVGTAIEALPDAQREVIRLRDVEGWSAPEVCEALDLSEGNQRVLLHRARAKVRAALETYLDPELVS